MKKWIAVILSALMLCSAAACSADDYRIEEVDASKLPSRLDLRDHDGKNYVTSVKSQHFGDCWSFSLAGSAEIAYLYANDMGVPAGEINDNVNFSEKYVAWYMFHGITVDDVARGKVRSSQVGEGFDPREAEKETDKIAYIIGGPYIHSANLFGAGFGPVDESVSVKGEYPYAYNDEASVEWQLPLNAEYRNAPTDAILRNSNVLESPASTDENGDYALNEEGLIAIKSELCKGHGVSLGMRTQHPGFNRENKAAYYDGEDAPDHAVTVVGYDDDYPKEKFSRTDLDGNVIEGSTPPADGAFIIKNSWGIMDSEEDGYFYLSYYDHSIVTPLSYEFDAVKSLRHTALNYDQYDLMMTKWYGHTDYDDEIKMANVFDAEEDESLYQIAYVTASAKTEVSYEIYKGVDDDDPSSGELLEKGGAGHLYPGFHRLDLKGEYALKKGEKYAVVLTMKHPTDEDGGMAYTEVFPYSTEFFNGMTVTGIINMGESYLCTDGSWRDMARMKGTLIDRAYQQCVEEVIPGEKDSRIKADSRDTFTVDNYPIKAILTPAE